MATPVGVASSPSSGENLNGILNLLRISVVTGVGIDRIPWEVSMVPFPTATDEE